MNGICKWIIVLCAALFALTAGAQGDDKAKGKKGRTVDLCGEVYDSFTKGRIKARIVVMTADSTVVEDDSLSAFGTYSEFRISVPRRDAKYIIKLEHDDYETTYSDYNLKIVGRKSWYVVPRILMKRKARSAFDEQNLKELVVRGTRIQVAYKGDTIVYDASAFNLPEGSMLDALVRQLPGAELKDNGDIYINGEKIDYLTLNGADFFKGDNKVMLENLPYFTVKNLQVYHRSTERSRVMGHDVEAKEYVMDVRLKREYARGYVLNAEAGAGTEKRYMARMFGLYYDDHNRVSLYGNVNNVNETRKPGYDGDWTPANMSRSVYSHRRTGMDIRTEDKDKRVEERFSTSLTWTGEDGVNTRHSETFAPQGNINERQNSTVKDKDFYFHADNSMYFSKIFLNSYVSVDYSSSKNDGTTDMSSERDGKPVNSRQTLTRSKDRRTNLNTFNSWGVPLKNGDVIYANLNAKYNGNKPVDSFRKEHTTYAATGADETENKYTDRHSSSYSYELEGGYLYQLPNSWHLQTRFTYHQMRDTRYDYIYRLDRLDNETYDHLGTIPATDDERIVAFDGENSELSSVLTREYGAEVALRKNTKDFNFQLYLPLKHIREKMDYTQATLDTVTRRSATVFDPSVNYRRYGDTPIDLSYSLDVRQPDFKNLMPVVNTSDNLATYINNPDLRNTITHNFNGRITFKNTATGGSTYVGADAVVRLNNVGRRVTYNTSTGASTYKADNVDGNWNATVKGGMDRPLDKDKRLRLNVSGNVKYERSVDFAVAYDEASDALSKVDNVYTTLNTRLTYRFKMLSAGVVGKLTYRHSTGNMENFATLDVYDYQYGGNLQYTIPWIKLNVSTDLNMFCRRGYASASLNTDDLIWNAQISRTFAKGRITAKLAAFDLLRNLSNVRYSVNAQGRTETWYNSIPRYVMLSMAYSFKQKPNKKS